MTRPHRLRLTRPRHTTVVAYLALLAALGGTAFGLPGSNTVRSDDIKNGEVRAADIDTAAVGPEEIVDDSVISSDVAPDAVTAEKLGLSTVREEEILTSGVLAEDLAPGVVGASELGPVTRRAGPGVVINDPSGAADGEFATDHDTALCLPGEIAIGGGTRWSDQSDDQELVVSRAGLVKSGPVAEFDAYRARGGNDTGAAKTFTAEVLCLG